MKKGLLIISLCLLIFGCRKDHDIPPKEETLPSYIKKLLPTDTNNPYEGGYYILVSFTNNATAETKKLHLDENNSSMAFRYDSSDKEIGLSEQTVLFISDTIGERLEISFYYDLAQDTAFILCNADYLYGDVWKGTAGANVQYCKPVSQDDKSHYYIYRGENDGESYFRITHLENGCVNGTFHTIWKECCGEATTYDVTGDFCIPVFTIRF